MQVKRILFPTDFSHLGNAGLPLAASIARDQGAELVILHVKEPPVGYVAGELVYDPIETSDEPVKLALQAIKPSDPRVRYMHKMVTGEPSTEIVRAAEDEGVDLIVMSTHGRTGLSRMFMGSVAEAVVRRASCPVLTFKQPAKTEVTQSAERSLAMAGK